MQSKSKKQKNAFLLNPKNAEGFTLVELLIVIAIMAIIATITLPNFFPSRYKYSVTKDAEGMVYNIRNAVTNSQSQLYGSRWGIHLGSSTSTSGYFYETWYGTSTYAYGTVYKHIGLDSGVTYSGLPLGSSMDICFAQVSGLPVNCGTGVSTSTSVTLTSPTGFTTTIAINTNGSISY